MKHPADARAAQNAPLHWQQAQVETQHLMKKTEQEQGTRWCGQFSRADIWPYFENRKKIMHGNGNREG